MPEYCSWTDDDGMYVMEVYLPGVEKHSLRLKMNKDNIFVFGETDSVRYDGAFGLCCPIDTEHVTSTYKNGLLRIEAPYLDPTFDTVDVKIE
ncbi:MAG: Hsp20/alpha crystallin family protein [Promethearchaeota archaeon]